MISQIRRNHFITTPESSLYSCQFQYGHFQIKTDYFFIEILFPDSLAGKESSFNAGDPGSIPGSGRSSGEGIGYPFQYSWASLVAQMAKNPPEMQETLVRFLDLEDPLEKGKATHCSILGLPWWLSW